MSEHYDRYNGMEKLLGTNLAEVGADLISRQAAIDAVKDCYCGGEDSCGEPWIYEDHAIKAIKQLPPANCSVFPNNSDTISRQQAIDMCRKPCMRNADCSDFEMEIMMLPSVQPKRGKWIDKGWTGDWQYLTDGRGNCWRNIVCSECGESVRHESNFCPHCGAKMEVTE